MSYFLIALFLIAPQWLVASDPLKAPGVGNFRQVNNHLYRGAQPASAGYKSLAKLGIKTIIDLRGGEGHAEAEKKLVQAAGMRYVSVPMSSVSAPSDEQISEVLTLLDDSAGWPVFVHCQRGADRTGTVIACYRIAHDQWQNDKALAEAKLYGIRWFEHAMQEYILHFRK